VAPAGTPPEYVAKIQRDIARVVALARSAQAIARYRRPSQSPTHSEEFAARIKKKARCGQKSYKTPKSVSMNQRVSSSTNYGKP